MREFDTGATRDDDTGKFDFLGFESPLVRHAYAAYMHAHRMQTDGTLRDSDNWKKGMPLNELAKSAKRHFFQFESLHEGYALPVRDGEDAEVNIINVICATLFNLNTYLHQFILERDRVMDIITDYADGALDDPNQLKLWDDRGNAAYVGGERRGMTIEEAAELEVERTMHIVELQDRLQGILDLVASTICTNGAEYEQLLTDIEDLASGQDQLDKGDTDAEA